LSDNYFQEKNMAKADYDGTAFLETLDEKHILPSLSPVVAALIELAADEESSVGQIADLITKDPSLTARILKLANSAFFQSRYSASTALQAVTRIGVHHTRLFALSVSFKDAFPLKRGGPLDYGRFWRLCLYQGLLARWLAHTLKQGDPEEAFTAGLTMEIGLLVLVRACADDATIYLDYPLPALLAKEKELYGVHHRQIGEALLRSWRFPERIVACQQSYAFRENLAELPELARICAIAGELSAVICEPQTDLTEMFERLEAFFGLSKSVATEAVGAAMEHVSEIAELFEVEIDGRRDMIELMEKANRALTILASNVLEYTTIQRSPFSEIPPELSSPQHASAGVQEGVSHEIRNRLTFVGRFAKRLAKTIDPASREGTYVRVIMSEAERLEQALHGTG
jgi:two-component system cell cycle response regulator